eukprot:TRINITY_DN8918_c0_g1_i2.p2 TRINITY_DN8918_c0_g1~~TRINITY_DN8918_c0_g1_i2.p2  ORF type:complete len:154 (-),score=11.06 TRINITY_DN8918_c0_g1_i2:233-694(-)
MGKTGSINWHQVKGVNGQIRLVPQKEGEVKKPGPNQRFKRASIVSKIESRMANNPQQGRGRGRGPKITDQRIRRRIRRSKKSMMGAKAKAKRQHFTQIFHQHQYMMREFRVILFLLFVKSALFFGFYFRSFHVRQNLGCFSSICENQKRTYAV